MKGFFNKYTSKEKLFYPLFGCFLAFIALVLLGLQTTKIYSDEIYQNIRKSTTENVKTITSDRVKMLDRTLKLLEAQAQTLAMHFSEPSFDLSAKNLKKYVKMDDDFIRIVVFYADGTAFSTDNAITFVAKDSEVYQQVFAGKSSATDTFIGNMGYKEINIYAPMYRGSEIIGGVYINFDAEVLRNAGASSLYNSSGYSYLLKRDGTILLAPSSYSFAQIYNNVQDVFLVSKNNQTTVDKFMTALKNGDSGNAVLDFSGNMQIICFEPLTEKKDWYYVSVLPLALVENNGQTVLQLSSQMISLFSVIILIFVFLLFAVIFFMLRDKWKKEVNEGRVYKAISENIHTAIFIMDQSSRYIRHAFENMQNVLGIEAKKIQGCKFSQEWLEKIGIPIEVAAMVEQADKLSKPVAMELKYYSFFLKKEVWMNISVSPLYLKSQREYIVAFTDITENKRLMEELRTSMLEAQSASAAKSSFLANMSHDIRTPMNAITGMADIALSNIENKNRVLDCLTKISLSSKHLKGLINDILDMSKIESGKLSLNSDITSLSEILKNLTQIVQIQTNEKHQNFFVITKQVYHELVVCDAVRLNQVLLNILANAVKFTPNKGNIYFYIEETTSSRGAEYRQYQFCIKDSGIGMSKEFQKTIFDSFSREKGNRVDKIEGSGLGMAISKWIVDKMDGTICVTSEIGQGSEFIVTLHFPLAKDEKFYTFSNLSLLLADEEKQSLENTAAIFRKLNIHVDTVSTIEAATDIISCKHNKSINYDIILLNNNMLKKNPIKVISQIKNSIQTKQPKLVLISYQYLEELKNIDGIAGILTPPFFPSTLYQDILQIISPQTKNSNTLSTDKSLEGIRIILAEDNELNREICVELLSSHGVLTDTVENGLQCLEKFLSSPSGYYQMILTDIQMPVMNGYESVRQIRASCHLDAKTIPILAVTADAFSEDIESAKKAGMNGHLSKPLDMSQVITEMKKYCHNLN